MNAILHGGITTPNKRTFGYAANKSKKAATESLSIADLATVIARRAIHLAKAAMKIANYASNIAEDAIIRAKLARAPCESRHATECRRGCRMDRSRKVVSRPRELRTNPLAPGRPQFGDTCAAMSDFATIWKNQRIIR